MHVKISDHKGGSERVKGVWKNVPKSGFMVMYGMVDPPPPQSQLLLPLLRTYSGTGEGPNHLLRGVNCLSRHHGQEPW